MLSKRETLSLLSSLLVLAPMLAEAQQSADAGARREALEKQKAEIEAQLRELDRQAAPAPASSAAAVSDEELETVLVQVQRPHAAPLPVAQTALSVEREQFRHAPGLNIAEVLAMTPGVTFVQGNGPRDVSLSVRGSNNRQTFGVRNIKLFEDGFPVTQPDGLGRTDLTDPHAYSRIDVVQGPSSAGYGNYATGGAVLFYTRPGRELRGAELALDAGSYDYLNAYATVGDQGERYEYSGFFSNARGESKTAHTGYLTNTANILASFQLTPRDRVVFKFIDNEMDASLSIRLSLNQYRQNPYQQHCGALEGTACASVSLFENGFNGSKVLRSPQQAGLLRNDRRTILGARWEHDFDAQTQARLQAVFDNRDIKQPTSATGGLGNYPSFNFSGELAHGGLLWERASQLTLGGWYQYQNSNAYSFNLRPDGHAALGGMTQYSPARVQSMGLKFREELQLASQWSLVGGLAGEFTRLLGRNTAYSYPSSGAPTTSITTAQRSFFNLAPELALQYRPDAAWRLHARAASGYGTPQVSNLFVTPEGVAGNNTRLKAQRNLGFDLGASWTPNAAFSAALTGFYEFFRNELVSQSPGANLLSYTYNAPRSEHRGVELALKWQMLPQRLPGLSSSLAYLYDDQLYRDYQERLSAGSQSRLFTRDKNKIPGVQPQYLNARLAYDQPAGWLKGWGAYVEANYRESFFLDNANLLKAPGYTIYNLNLHYQPAAEQGLWSRLGLHLAVQNLFDKTYVGSAANISDSIDSGTGAQRDATALAASTGSIYAGGARAVYGGFNWKF
ncbi:iron complex outermembrane recepter protein [Solimonas aquatica]|uniref:Iron complex outermembrane recepter protein n=1 Tax=Solimonas aquatica TaxID=489703 RepID=A0A1H9FQI7_9GAMM|nr:TonB-dependent receptor [Solimonas aquatica]SEQ40157.1 iron complex outermembrane recepter protein [Solimonas aquatica]